MMKGRAVNRELTATRAAPGRSIAALVFALASAED
jgi:hypothetical protein